MKVKVAIQKLACIQSRVVYSLRGPTSWDGNGSLRQHRRAGLLIVACLGAIAIRCACVSDMFGTFLFSLISLMGCIAAACSWFLDRATAVQCLGTSKSAQECANLIVNELREEGISFDEEQLAESVATVMLQQSLDLSGFVEATVQHSHDASNSWASFVFGGLVEAVSIAIRSA